VLYQAAQSTTNIKQHHFGTDIICQPKHYAVQLILYIRKFCNISLFTTQMFKNAVAAVVVMMTDTSAKYKILTLVKIKNVAFWDV
jgi:hypothetical protein